MFRVRLPFLDRVRELARLRRALSRPGGALIVVYGRRRCGKSRLLQETLRGQEHVYYLADLGDAGAQRRALAVEAGRVVAGFAAASYGDWGAILETWRRWRSTSRPNRRTDVTCCSAKRSGRTKPTPRPCSPASSARRNASPSGAGAGCTTRSG